MPIELQPFLFALAHGHGVVTAVVLPRGKSVKNVPPGIETIVSDDRFVYARYGGVETLKNLLSAQDLEPQLWIQARKYDDDIPERTFEFEREKYLRVLLVAQTGMLNESSGYIVVQATNDNDIEDVFEDVQMTLIEERLEQRQRN